jgi:hypothetical protein
MAEPDPVRQYVERFALVLADLGMQRMTARVLALLVCSDDASLTAGDIQQRLDVSAAATSMAVRELIAAGVADRVPVPGSRRVHYRLSGDTWAGAGAVKQQRFVLLAALAADGLATVPPGGPAAARLAEMRDFNEFLAEEMPGLLSRWQQRSARRSP